MSEKEREVRSLEKTVAGIFKAEDKRLEKEYKMIFLREALRGYEKTANELDSDFVKKEEICQRVLAFIQRIAGGLSILKEMGASDLEKAKNLGSHLGNFMTVMEHGIASDNFKEHYEKRPKKFDSDIKMWVRIIIWRLDELGTEVKIQFIRKEIERIVRRHQKYLSAKQKSLLMNIAAIGQTKKPFWG